MKRILLFILLIYSSIAVFAQNTITGVVKDSKGATVPHASVTIRGTKSGVSADENGKFTLNVTTELPFYIRISSVGFKPQDFQIISIQNAPSEFVLVSDDQLQEIVVVSRRRQELLQDVPIPVSVIGGAQIDKAGAFNVNRVKELVPSLQLYTSNPRNTGINIRGIGSPFGLTNDGLDPGVGFYVDGVYYARPAAATLDFIDIDNIEVLRGPQGTLFGKNTSAGAINITTRKASFTPGIALESSFGNYGYIQTKASVTGPLAKDLAARISFSGTQRNGLIQNEKTQVPVNDINNIGARAQFLYTPSDKVTLTLSGDASDQKPNGYAQVIAGVAPTLRAAYRQFNNIITDLGYKLPSTNAFDRVIDHDAPWRSGNQLGGVSLNADFKIGSGTLTSTTAWRYWNWDPSNDRDFTGLPVLTKSQNPSKHHQESEEIRYAGDINDKLSGVVGLYFLDQKVTTTGREEAGSAEWRFAQSTTNTALWQTPGLFEGYGITTNSWIRSQTAAAFANLDWKIADVFHINPGVRFNYDKKDVYYNRVANGGVTITDPTLLGFRNALYSSQFYTTNFDEKNFTYQVTASYRPSKTVNAFATYSTSYKPSGVNVAGLPTISNAPALSLAVIKPEKTKHFEFGAKTNPADNFTLNVTFHNSDIKDYQTNVQSPDPGVNRGYLATAEKVNVKGAELDANYQASKNFTFYASGAYTDAKYVKFTNAPLPLEQTGLTVNGTAVYFKDISGTALPGVSKWTTSAGGEFATDARFISENSKFFIGVDDYFRSRFSSSPTPSKYLNIASYTLVNARLGFRAAHGVSAYVWSRNLLNQNYYEQLLPATGNAGQYAGVLGDQRTFGITLRYVL
ncbi:TonB-dependent receptor [Mucilaginibacter corticis]|uniref:TonB-dependent receptor n=1 Tax=Mucilaginibacter corticis TaxID=2597670 RepID=A0A556MLQ9_9SPHI|nr:TonB-dependent receptor [Mucilaginibacter corticis]TSJ40861.1 TonB-dependent receptor [Mucilaginibacter corticis]